jgi:uncharacterized protein
MPTVTLQVQSGTYAVCRLAPADALPAWATEAGPFLSLTRTEDELSLIVPESIVPAAVRAERGWTLVKFAGPFDFGAVGILASVAQPIAAAGISLLALGTFDTDYVLIKSDRLDAARRILTAAGHAGL